MVNPAGIILVVLGVSFVVWPYRFARFEERIDAIGSKRSWSDVEPAGWKVKLTRILGIVFTIIGLGITFSG